MPCPRSCRTYIMLYVDIILAFDTAEVARTREDAALRMMQAGDEDAPSDDEVALKMAAEEKKAAGT